MHKVLLAQSPLLALPLVALFLFFGVFVLVLARTTLKKRGSFDAAARLPLENDTNEQEPRRGTR